MLEIAVNKLIESEIGIASKIELINDITKDLTPEYISDLKVKLYKQLDELATEHDLCSDCGVGFEWHKGKKLCQWCGGRSDNE